jgi:NADPH:quinone reductase-like Zn-dependent oxidoreductase
VGEVDRRELDPLAPFPYAITGLGLLASRRVEESIRYFDDALSFEQAAAFPLVYETAYRMLVTKAGLREGEWVLVWGIGGGVATAAFEIARALGARTIVTSSSDAKLERAREVRRAMRVADVDWDLLAEHGASWMTYWDQFVRGQGR